MKILFLLLPLTTFLILISKKLSRLLFYFFLNSLITGILYFYLNNPLFGLLIIFLYIGTILVIFVFILPLIKIEKTLKEKKFNLFIYLMLSYILIFISFNISNYFDKKTIYFNIKKLSNFLIKDYIGFELVSVLLLVTIVGSFLLIRDES
ncbi:MAG: NADH-quinone oxidoreductase subunit J [candidate division WOR-3 bacterium]